MKKYTASQARQSFAELIQAVEHGADVAITKHGKAIAKITPVRDEAIPAPGWGAKEGWSIKTTSEFKRIPAGFEDYT